MRNVNSDVAYNYVRKRILSGEFPPGHPLLTNDLSTEIGVSRTPVRDALRQLEADGLVTIKARLGASVKTMDATEYRELCGMRLALEGYAAGLAATNRTDADLQEMRFALEAMRKLTEKMIASKDEEPFMAELVREDVRFHIAIMTAAKSDLIKKEILRLHLVGRVVSAKAPGSPKKAADKKASDANRNAVLKDHDRIFAAIAKGDSGVAKAEMEQHIQAIIDKQLKAMMPAEAGHAARKLTDEELAYTAEA